MDNQIAKNFWHTELYTVRTSVRPLGVHWGRKMISWEVTSDEVYQDHGSKPPWIFSCKLLCVGWFCLFSPDSITDKFTDLQSRRNCYDWQVWPLLLCPPQIFTIQTCPGGNSVIAICGYPCKADLVCHFLHKVLSGMGRIWHFMVQ